MTIAEQYAAACRPPKWKILGRRMQDFTVHHSELLEQIGFNSGKVQPQDLLVALRLCSRTGPRAEAVLRGGWNLFEFLTLLLFKMRPEIFDRAALSFLEYVAHAKKEIRFWADKKSTRNATCPATLLILRDLSHYHNLSEAEILAMPYGKAEWWRLAAIEAEGGLEFYTDGDNDLITEAARICREEFENSQTTEATSGNS